METDIHPTVASVHRGRPLCNLRFADHIDLLGGSEEELQQLTERLEKTAAGYGMEISSDKSKILVNSIMPRPSANIWISDGKRWKKSTSSNRYTQTKDGTPIKEGKIRLAPAHSVVTRLSILWKNNAISFPTKIKLCKSLVLSILLYGYGCESSTLMVDLDGRIQAFEGKCYRRLLGISYGEHKTNKYVWHQVNVLPGHQELLPSSIAVCYVSAISVINICCRRSYYRGQWMVVIAEEDLMDHGGTASRNGQVIIATRRGC